MPQPLSAPVPLRSPSGFMNRADLLSAGLLLLAVLLAYGHTLHVPWFFDDYANIVENPLLRDLRLAASSLLAPRGIAYFTFALNYHFGGLNPVGYHLVNIALHLGNGLLVYLLLKRFFPQPRPWLARFGALLFVLHPLQTQAVTYTVQRMTSLSAGFFLLALYAFLRAREALEAGASFRAPRHLFWYGAALLGGALAVTTKQNTAILPLALLLVARFFPVGGPRSWAHLLGYLAPFCLVPLGLGAQSLLMPLLSGRSLQQISRVHHAGSDPSHYLFTEFKVLWIYLRLFLLPYGQALDHDYPLVTTLLDPAALLGLVGLGVLGVLAFFRRHVWPALVFGLAWFFLTLAIESSFIPLDPLFEHRLYLPLFGLCVAATAGLGALPGPRFAVPVAVGLLLVLALLSWQRNRLWTSQIALFEDNLRQVPQSRRVRENLAASHLIAGQNEAASRLLQSGGGQSVEGAIHLATVYLAEGKVAEAEALLTRTIQLHPFAPLPSLYLQLAEVHVAKQDLQAAVAAVTTGLQFNPGHLDLLSKLGMVYLSFNQPQQALEPFRQVVARDPRGADAHFHLGLAYYYLRRLPEALAEFQRTLKLVPKDREALQNAATVAMEMGDQATARIYIARLKALPPRQ